ncbi:MAG TPA: murein L,D-transpeptidase catalytic domain family protein, partial [Anseongella sp.]|nr:murein L,D-transpeptidase catalytic domain family protein [Anseongella sp.]
MKRNFLYSIAAFGLLALVPGIRKAVPANPAEQPSAVAESLFVREDKAGENASAETGRRASDRESAYRNHTAELYEGLQLSKAGLDREVFTKALTGYYNLKAEGKLSEGSSILSIADFSKPSREKRLWIIDLDEKGLLYHTWVAHGKGSGGNTASKFSNTESSHQSSLGFYVTGEVYYGKHGRSLRLDGMDAGFNSNARKRAIVLHGANYVSKSFIEQVGRLGRSYGCPAVSTKLSNGIIDHL